MVLVFDDGLRYTLGTKVNIKRLVQAFGKMCSSWIGREIEFYFAEDVRGPNGEVGGIRLRIPERPAQAPPATGSAGILVTELPSGGGAQ